MPKSFLLNTWSDAVRSLTTTWDSGVRRKVRPVWESEWPRARSSVQKKHRLAQTDKARVWNEVIWDHKRWVEQHKHFWLWEAGATIGEQWKTSWEADRRFQQRYTPIHDSQVKDKRQDQPDQFSAKILAIRCNQWLTSLELCMQHDCLCLCYSG